MKLNYKVLKSGSAGNCTVLGFGDLTNPMTELIMIDCGIAYKTLKNLMIMNGLYFENVRYFFLTHQHSDHHRKTTLANLKRIKCELFASEITKVKLAQNYNITYKTFYTVKKSFNITLNQKSVKVKSYELTHGDVLTTGYTFEHKNHKLLYATDFNKTSELPDEKFDVILIEGNYNQVLIKHILKTGNYKEVTRARHNLNHNSKQNAFIYVHEHLRPDGVYEILHKSEAFYN